VCCVSQAINRLHELCLEGESIIDSRAISARLRGDIDEPLHSQEAVAAAAVAAAHDQQAVLIVVLTGAGFMGRLVAKYHPVPPVLLVCESDRVARQAYLSRGLAPMVRADHGVQPLHPFRSLSLIYLSYLTRYSLMLLRAGVTNSQTWYRSSSAALTSAGQDSWLLPA
jgi:pyruvate kinase